MEKLSFSEMEEVKGGIDPLIFGLCGALAGGMLASHILFDVYRFNEIAAAYDDLGCKAIFG